MFSASYHYLLGSFESDVGNQNRVFPMFNCTWMHDITKGWTHKHIGILKEGMHLCIFVFNFHVCFDSLHHCEIFGCFHHSFGLRERKKKIPKSIFKVTTFQGFFSFHCCCEDFLYFYHVIFIRGKHKKKEKTPKFRINASRV